MILRSDWLGKLGKLGRLGKLVTCEVLQIPLAEGDERFCARGNRLLPVKLVEVWCRNLSEVGSNKAMEGAWYGLQKQKCREIILPNTIRSKDLISCDFMKEYHSTFHCAKGLEGPCATEVDQLSCLFQHWAPTNSLGWSGYIWMIYHRWS